MKDLIVIGAIVVMGLWAGISFVESSRKSAERKERDYELDED